MSTLEVIVTIDGVPRPAVVVAVDGDRTQVRFRDAGGFREEWLPSSQVLSVEAPGSRPPYLKLVGLVVLAAVGLVLVLYPGSDKRLSDVAAPQPTPTASPTPAPTATALPRATAPAAPAAVVRAAVLGDSFSAGKGNASGTLTALQLATRALRWTTTLQNVKGSGFTTLTNSVASRLATVPTAPTVLVLQAGASDTAASPAQLTSAAGAVLDTVRRRFPSTRVIVVGPVAMEQPADGQLVRVNRTLAAVAKARKVAFVDPIASGWITPANAGRLTSSTGFYPNAKGHAFLAERLEAALAKLR